MKELWKQIEEHPEYYISNLGRVKSRKYRLYNHHYEIAEGKKEGYVEKIVKSHKHKTGYMGVTISTNNKVTTHYIHRLVATAFLDNKENLPQVNHIDGCKTNNSLQNLEFCNASYNGKHAYAIGLKKAETIHVAQYDAQGNLVMIWSGLPEIEEAGYNKRKVRHNIIYVPANNKPKKTYQGFYWEFLRDFII